MKVYNTIIIGGGYAGLSAAYELSKLNIEHILIEKNEQLGGLSRTFELNGSYFDLGPHTYFDKDEEVVKFWKGLIGDKLKNYERNSKIYYNKKYINSPLKVLDAAINLGFGAAFKMFASFFYSKIFNRNMPIENSKDWVVANFGEELYVRFFKVYNEKIWGLDCKEITCNWAGHRIKSSLFKIFYKSIFRDKTFIVRSFNFPDQGSSTVFNALNEKLDKSNSCEIKFRTIVTDISYDSNEGTYQIELNKNETIFASNIISTMPLEELVHKLFKQDERIKKIADKLRYRNLILCLINVDNEDVVGMEEHWIDIHDPAILSLRVTNFRNYKCGMAAEGKSPFCLEYNCFEEEKIWNASDEEIYDLAIKDLKGMRLLKDIKKYDFKVVRFPKAYPLYYKGYEPHVEAIKEKLLIHKNIHTIGRAGMYKWNNMHHSIKTGILAARNVSDEKHDLWNVKGLVALGKDYNNDDDT